MELLAYLHSIIHPLIIWFANLFSEITQHSGPLYNWQTLVGSFLWVFLSLLIGFTSYLCKKRVEKLEKRKEAIQFTEIYITQSINHALFSIIQIEAFLKRIQNKIKEIEEIGNDTSYFPGETNFPPMADIGFDQNILKSPIGSYYLHNKIMSAEHMISFTNAAMRKFDTDFTNLLARNEANMIRLSPWQQRYQYTQDLKWYSGIVLVVISDLKNEGIKLLTQAKIYNLKLMQDYKWTKKYYEKGEMDLEKMKKIDQLIEAEVKQVLNNTK